MFAQTEFPNDLDRTTITFKLINLGYELTRRDNSLQKRK